MSTMAESISLEETNKIRISLGLKPLTDDAASADTKEQTAEDNFAKRKEQDAQERERRFVLLGVSLGYWHMVHIRRIQAGIAKWVLSLSSIFHLLLLFLLVPRHALEHIAHQVFFLG